YQLLYTQTLIQSPDGHLITHLGFAFVVVFLSLMLKDTSRKRWYLLVVLLLLSLGITAYLMIELEEILEYRTSIPATSDLIVGTLLIVILLVGGWLVFGKTFTIVSLVAVGYLVVGRYLPPPFTVPAISYVRLLMWLSVELGTGKGVYGDILDLSATYLFLFIFFGGVLYAFGGTRFIIGLGLWVGSKLRSGPAMVALIGSSLLGTVTGSTVANITITGSYTIPMMKRSGYTPEQAGAIETVSSNGGQITPPIMGATAFLMAGFANIPYIQIVIAAIVPALLKFICVFFYITLTAKKMEIRASVEPVKGRQLLLDSPIFILPLGVLVFLLVKGYTLPFVGFWSILTIIIVGLIMSAVRKEARLNFRETFDKVVSGIRSASEIAMICGLLGVVVSAIVSSGLAVKLPLAIEDLSHGILPIALFITMISSMLLGIGVPTPAAYMLVAVGAVPSLLKMGVPLLPAHFFCFVSAICSHITPPIAIGALVASKIAGADYWKTCWESVKAAFAKYLLPFFFIYAPVVLLRPDAGFVPSLLQVVAILAVIFSLQIGVSNYCFTKLRLDETIAFIIASMFSLAAVFTRDELFLFIGLALFLVSITRQFMIGRKLKIQTGGAPI
ncbi:TRAP transporter fused permease subunit, partial [bacterium]|nr:TRAP transporter fused permease subunit [bacterium]